MMILKTNICRTLITTLIIAGMTFPLSIYAKEYGPLKTGDSLWEIAAKISPSDTVSRYQTIIALQKLNPEAFSVSCNINSLKINVVLQAPSLAQAEALTAEQAFEEYTRQNEAWKNRKKQDIVCPAVTEPVAIATETPVVKNDTVQPIETKEILPTESLTDTQDTSAETLALTTTDDTTESTTEVSTNDNDVQPTVSEDEQINPLPAISFSTDFMSWTNLSILLIVGFILATLLSWLLYRQSSQKYVQQRVLLKNPFSDHLDEISLHIVDPDAEKSRERLKVVAVNSTDKSTGHSEANNLRSKLTTARMYLAEGHVKEVHELLNEVIKQGSPTQRQEAQQLLKITQSMKELQQQVASTQLEETPKSDKPEDTPMFEGISANKQSDNI
jgi:FimV-like protein